MFGTTYFASSPIGSPVLVSFDELAVGSLRAVILTNRSNATILSGRRN